ncbi:hypothetical protein BX616_006380 [Lobosporangium transversale]|uniref:Uncharacterized protein n=1 Tax=Lobosporangium transversale TaxID=64571 RepID=A0A1Y2GA65_9FUNG|nr:hypothetical protein BCR41DRAFT_361896 [Lobosporangium transversale]KAF9915336.1 hypothetical protein BX616_006380 [Lobosporangium transversale]ORZ05326.1 hypothetical protein BCR41DRAFT_361896 [Lobosporangium transversale]|eukprot:XP_021877018.1 hypothetical protein BCR41DRAFT_361896 [Lobosporangium transversale]
MADNNPVVYQPPPPYSATAPGSQSQQAISGAVHGIQSQYQQQQQGLVQHPPISHGSQLAYAAIPVNAQSLPSPHISDIKHSALLSQQPVQQRAGQVYVAQAIQAQGQAVQLNQPVQFQQQTGPSPAAAPMPPNSTVIYTPSGHQQYQPLHTQVSAATVVPVRPVQTPIMVSAQTPMLASPPTSPPSQYPNSPMQFTTRPAPIIQHQNPVNSAVGTAYTTTTAGPTMIQVINPPPKTTKTTTTHVVSIPATPATFQQQQQQQYVQVQNQPLQQYVVQQQLVPTQHPSQLQLGQPQLVQPHIQFVQPQLAQPQVLQPQRIITSTQQQVLLVNPMPQLVNSNSNANSNHGTDGVYYQAAYQLHGPLLSKPAGGRQNKYNQTTTHTTTVHYVHSANQAPPPTSTPVVFTTHQGGQFVSPVTNSQTFIHHTPHVHQNVQQRPQIIQHHYHHIPSNNGNGANSSQQITIEPNVTFEVQAGGQVDQSTWADPGLSGTDTAGLDLSGLSGVDLSGLVAASGGIDFSGLGGDFGC